MRWISSSLLAVLVVLGLFLLMQWMIAPPDGAVAPPQDTQGVDIVRVEPEEEEPPDLLQQLESEPPPPPAAPSALDRPDAPAVSVPALSASMDAGPIRIPMAIGGAAATLGGSGAFGGFAGGSGSGGYGQGQGFKGKELVPLSTARPQIPEWAYKRGIEGWVEVVFTVMPNGRVQDVRIIDAQPKGVFETIAIESISNWIYAEHPKARMVKQKVEFKLSDFQYNWR